MNIDKFYDKAADWVIQKGPAVIIGIIVLFVGLWVINQFVHWSRSRLHKKDVDPSLKPFFISLLSITLRILLILAVMQIVGIQMTLFAAVLGAFGVAAGLALSGTLQNFASGVLILLLKPFRVNDNIITQGLEGTVTSIQIFYTVVTTFDNKTVIVPNGKLSNEVIINLSCEGNRRLDIELKFNYGIDHEQVKTILNEAIDASKNILDKPERRIGISALEADGYKIMVNVWLEVHGFQDDKMALQENLIKYLKSAGVKLPGIA
jgi:small conductance mechanosensitive channel